MTLLSLPVVIVSNASSRAVVDDGFDRLTIGSAAAMSSDDGDDAGSDVSLVPAVCVMVVCDAGVFDDDSIPEDGVDCYEAS